MERNLEQFDLRSTCVDLLKNIWVILLAVIAAYFGVTGFYQLQYVPEYTSTATLAVTMRGNNGGAYSSLSTTTEMAGFWAVCLIPGNTTLWENCSAEAKRKRDYLSLLLHWECRLLSPSSGLPPASNGISVGKMKRCFW